MKNFHHESDIKEISNNLSGISNDLSGKTILITGGRGFLGRYFSEVIIYLNKNKLVTPCKLIILDNFITSGDLGKKIITTPNIEFVEHNVIDPLNVEQKIDYIIHAAGIASPFYYRAHPLETLEVASIGTKNMLELAKKSGSRFIFFSSSEIYGDPDPRFVPMEETYRGNVSVAGPRACYDESKRLGETLCYIYNNQFGISTNVIRPFNIYGPGMQEEDYRVLPNFASKIKSNDSLLVYSTGDQTRTFCYITDAITGFMLVLLKGVSGEAYNIGNPKPEVSMIDLIKHIKNVLGREIKYNFVEYPDSYPPDEPLRRCPNINKAKAELGYIAKIDLEEGLKRFFDWTNKNYGG